MNKEHKNEYLPLFLLAILIGICVAFILMTYLIAVPIYREIRAISLFVIPIFITIIIFFLSSNQTINIEESNKKISDFTDKLDVAFFGQAKDFKMLFEKMCDIIEAVNKNKGAKMTLILPILSFGFFNKEVRSIYDRYKTELIKLCKSNKEVELIFTNPFSQKIVDFFHAIIEQSEQSENKKNYENSYKNSIRELISFFDEIVKARSTKNEKIKISFVDDAFLSGIVADCGDCKYHSLYFFIGAELLKCQNALSGLTKEDYISESVYNNTPETYMLINDLINIQKQKANCAELFSKVSLDLFCLLLQEITDKLNIEKGDTKNIVEKILRETQNKFDTYSKDIKCNYINEGHLHLYSKNNNQEKNLLILPSAAGIYSHLNLGDRRNELRFEMYFDLMSKITNYNTYLFSFSGQGLIEDNGKFSAQQGINDLEKLSQYLENNVLINANFCICVGSQIYFDFCDKNQSSKLAKLPLIIWDLAENVGWKHYRWFQKSFRHIKVDTSQLCQTKEPIDALPAIYENKILYCYPSESNIFNKNKKYDGIRTKVLKMETSNNVFEYQKLNHIPEEKDDSEEFNELIQRINNFT